MLHGSHHSRSSEICSAAGWRFSRLSRLGAVVAARRCFSRFGARYPDSCDSGPRLAAVVALSCVSQLLQLGTLWLRDVIRNSHGLQPCFAATSGSEPRFGAFMGGSRGSQAGFRGLGVAARSRASWLLRL